MSQISWPVLNSVAIAAKRSGSFSIAKPSRFSVRRLPRRSPEIKPEPYDPEWKGGFYCPCHKSRYDISGRVFQGVPAPANLVVPPYKFVNDKQILIGVGPEGAA